jgi:hypothetical protein
MFVINTVESSSKCHNELHDAQVDEISRLLDIDHIEAGQGANQIRLLKWPGHTRCVSYLGFLVLCTCLNQLDSRGKKIVVYSTVGVN